jgi:thymidylate synthase
MMVNSIKGANPSETWLKAINLIIENGKRQGGLSREILNLISVMQNPLEMYGEVYDLFQKHIGSKWISRGAKCIFPITSNPGDLGSVRWSRTYWGRLTRYREKVDQLDFIVRRLKNKPHSKQLSCVTFDPEVDIQPHRPFNPSMPCMIAIDIKFRDGKLNIFAMFRSHDFGRKAYGNYIGLGKLLNMLSHETGYDIGEVVCYSVSAHIRAKEFNSICALIEEYKECKPASPNKMDQEAALETYNLV